MRLNSWDVIPREELVSFESVAAGTVFTAHHNDTSMSAPTASYPTKVVFLVLKNCPRDSLLQRLWLPFRKACPTKGSLCFDGIQSLFYPETFSFPLPPPPSLPQGASTKGDALGENTPRKDAFEARRVSGESSPRCGWSATS